MEQLEHCSVTLGKRESGKEPDLWHIEYGHWLSACDNSSLIIEMDGWLTDPEDWIDVRYRDDVCFECRCVLAQTFGDASEPFATYWKENEAKRLEEQRKKQEQLEDWKNRRASDATEGVFDASSDRFAYTYTEKKKKGKGQKNDSD